MDLAGWIDGYRRAWEEADTDLVLTLFTEDATYRSNPFEEPYAVTKGSGRTGTA